MPVEGGVALAARGSAIVEFQDHDLGARAVNGAGEDLALAADGHLAGGQHAHTDDSHNQQEQGSQNQLAAPQAVAQALLIFTPDFR